MNPNSPTLADTWTVQDALRPGRLHRILGDTDAVSLAAFEAAACVASGRPWFGQPVTAGSVLYLSNTGPYAPPANSTEAGQVHTFTVGQAPEKPEPSVLRLRLSAWKVRNGVDSLPAFAATGAVAVSGDRWYALRSAITGGSYSLVVFDDPSWVHVAQDPVTTVSELSRLAEITGAAIIITQYPSVSATGGSLLRVAESGNTVSLTITDRVGAAPLRLSRIPVPVDANGDRYTPDLLALQAEPRVALSVPGLR